MNVIRLFLGFISQIMNERIIAEIIKEEIKWFLFSFKKLKISGLGSWYMEFYSNLYEILEDDILRVVKERK